MAEATLKVPTQQASAQESAENNTGAATQASLQKILRRDNEEYQLVKKLPKRFPTSFTDIYVTTKTDFRLSSICALFKDLI